MNRQRHWHRHAGQRYTIGKIPKTKGNCIIQRLCALHFCLLLPAFSLVSLSFCFVVIDCVKCTTFPGQVNVTCLFIGHCCAGRSCYNWLRSNNTQNQIAAQYSTTQHGNQLSRKVCHKSRHKTSITNDALGMLLASYLFSFFFITSPVATFIVYYFRDYFNDYLVNKAQQWVEWIWFWCYRWFFFA